jgi:phosphate transport system ATP-binding protein
MIAAAAHLVYEGRPSLLAVQPLSKMEARNLDIGYGARHVLFDVSLAIPARGVTALMGPSGCGKSTFLRALNRMTETIRGGWHRGDIHLDGDDIHGPQVDPVELRRRVGMVFQRPNPFPMSIADNVAFGPRLVGRPPARELGETIERALHQAALWDEVKDRLDEPALGLSGGQQQRLCIARALAIEPEVLLLDEPTSALDPASTLRIEELLLSLKQHRALVLVTHSLAQARRCADEVAFFYEGRLVEHGLAHSVFTSPKDPRTAAYLEGRVG